MYTSLVGQRKASPILQNRTKIIFGPKRILRNILTHNRDQIHVEAHSIF